jgi:dTMP kinase
MDSNTTPTLPRFVVLEGLDGAGTTTQLRLIEKALTKAAIPHWITCEPTDLPSGRLVRQVLKGEVEARPETLARLFAADRNEHLYGKGGIVERLGRGELVVCDRYIFSSLAYQGLSCGPELPLLLNGSFPLPELLVFFSIPAAVSMSRVEGRESREIFETKPIQERVSSLYESVISGYEARGLSVLRVDASLPIEEVSARILQGLEKLIGARALR